MLAAIGAPNTAGNLAFLDSWHAYEGGTATNNPMNTTQPEPGASLYNSVGVRNYTNPKQGTTATATTLENGNYPALLAALRSGDPYTFFNPQGVAANLKTWGSSTFVPVYLLKAGSPAGAGGTPPPGGTITATGVIGTSGHRGYADLRNSLAKHLRKDLDVSRSLGLTTLRGLGQRSKVRR